MGKAMTLSENRFRTHSLVCLQWNDEPGLPKTPLIAKVLGQMTMDQPYWLDAEVLGYGKFAIRGGDCYKLVPPAGCARPEVCVGVDNQNVLDKLVAGMKPEHRERARTIPGQIRLPLGSQPAKLIPGLDVRARFSLERGPDQAPEV
jgi:hypothetical protein